MMMKHEEKKQLSEVKCSLKVLSPPPAKKVKA